MSSLSYMIVPGWKPRGTTASGPAASRRCRCRWLDQRPGDVALVLVDPSSPIIWYRKPCSASGIQSVWRTMVSGQMPARLRRRSGSRWFGGVSTVVSVATGGVGGDVVSAAGAGCRPRPWPCRRPRRRRRRTRRGRAGGEAMASSALLRRSFIVFSLRLVFTLQAAVPRVDGLSRSCGFGLVPVADHGLADETEHEEGEDADAGRR